MTIALQVMEVSVLVNVLFVCLGNICRSPSAEGVFRAYVEREGLSDHIAIDSAGTGNWHVGHSPDFRAQAAAKRRGIDLSELRARVARTEDFYRFDYVLAMDHENLSDLSRICPPGRKDRLALFLDFAPALGQRQVPDPYYGGAQGFEHMLDLIEGGSRELLAHIRRTHL